MATETPDLRRHVVAATLFGAGMVVTATLFAGGAGATSSPHDAPQTVVDDGHNPDWDATRHELELCLALHDDTPNDDGFVPDASSDDDTVILSMDGEMRVDVEGATIGRLDNSVVDTTNDSDGVIDSTANSCDPGDVHPVTAVMIGRDS